MPNRTPRERLRWESLIPPDSTRCDIETLCEENMKTTGKEYGYQPNFHVGSYETVREKSMGIGSIFVKSIEKKKTGDGLTIPLTLPAKKKSKNGCFSFPSCDGISRLFRTVIRDWIFLALLGFIMASLSFGMDYAILQLQNAQSKLYELVLPIHVTLSVLVWVGYVVGLTTASALFAHYIAPQAIGSGIPEMKTILRGVILKEYLTIRTLISKMIGLTLSLGSGLPMGKEGPFVHVASVVASQLSRLVHGSSGIFENETRSAEMLAAGCAVGVACTFSAPIGGVLFSIEVTSVYFAVRNYWRGFFAATCSATLFRILRMFSEADTLTVEAHYQTNFPPQNAFLPQELPVFALIGLICGVSGSAFVYIHRRTVLFLRRNWIAKKIFQKFWLIYPLFVAIVISSLSYPMGLGKFMGGEERFSHTMMEFFMNCTWTAEEGSEAACDPPPVNVSSGFGNKFDIHHWKGPNMDYSPFMTLAIFQFVYFFLSILASTLPVPSGIFMPVFVLGAAFGRMVGEGVYQWFPYGFVHESQFFVRPGIYAVVGAAAFCGAVTHTVSVAVIVFELTGQLCTLLPVMIAVLISNAVASYLQPSIYDSIIRIKNLPYLPDIPHTTSLYHQMLIEQFMITPVVYIAKDATLGDVKTALESKTRIRAFPLVDSKESLALIGSISRGQLQRLVDSKIGTKARFAEATRRVRAKLAEEERETSRRNDESELANDSQDSVKELTGTKRANRFLVVPVQRNGVESSKDSKLDGLSAENARKILTDREKQALFDASATSQSTKRETGGKTINATSSSSNIENNHHTIGDIFRSITQFSFGRQVYSKKESRNEFELYGEERVAWENSVLSEQLDLTDVTVDSSPFQLNEFTSLFKAHSLFSLLGLNRAYVTKRGQLIGVVALKELRFAIEYLHSGKMPTPGVSIFIDISNESPSTHDKAVSNMEGGESMECAESTREASGFMMGDNGEVDAEDDYIQPPIEVVRRRIPTPNPPEESSVQSEKAKAANPKFDISSPSTTSSCVSIDFTAVADSNSNESTANGELVLSVPSLPRVDSQASSERRSNRHVKIRLPSVDQENDEKF